MVIIEWIDGKYLHLTWWLSNSITNFFSDFTALIVAIPFIVELTWVNIGDFAGNELNNETFWKLSIYVFLDVGECVVKTYCRHNFIKAYTRRRSLCTSSFIKNGADMLLNYKKATKNLTKVQKTVHWNLNSTSSKSS